MMGLFLDEIIIGKTLALGSYEFNENNINRFREKFAPVPMHMSDDVAAKGLFGRRVAVGLHICCSWMTCFVAANTKARNWLAQNGAVLPEIGPSPGLTHLRWPNPVVAGDVVSYDTCVTAKRALNTRPTWGIVTCRSHGFNQHSVQVLQFESKILVAVRP